MRTVPWVNIVLIAANIAVFLFFNAAHPQTSAILPFRAGFAPRHLFQVLDGSFGALPETLLRLLTSMFLHGGWLHLLGNLVYLWIFGGNVEEVLGHRRYLVFYLLCGTAAALTHAGFHPASTVPVVGASGAVAGVLGAYLLFFPRARVKTLLFFGIFVRITVVPAALLLGLWALLQILGAAAADGSSPIAWFAHLGGFFTGMLAGPAFRRAKPHRRRA